MPSEAGVPSKPAFGLLGWWSEASIVFPALLKEEQVELPASTLMRSLPSMRKLAKKA